MCVCVYLVFAKQKEASLLRALPRDLLGPEFSGLLLDPHVVKLLPLLSSSLENCCLCTLGKQ